MKSFLELMALLHLILSYPLHACALLSGDLGAQIGREFVIFFDALKRYSPPPNLKHRYHSDLFKPRVVQQL